MISKTAFQKAMEKISSHQKQREQFAKQKSKDNEKEKPKDNEKKESDNGNEKIEPVTDQHPGKDSNNCHCAGITKFVYY